MSLAAQTSNITDSHNLKKEILPGLTGLAAVLLYLFQSINFSHYLDLTMDEGTYLMKGLLFIKGIYTPFQSYGPWTHKTPLAYYIPGLAELLFGPGLRTGRYLSIFFGLIFLIGLWLVARKFSNSWLAAAILWIMALNAANIMNYSQAITQAIISCMLIWSLAFLLVFERRKLLFSCLAALMGAIIFLTRQNLLPVLLIFLFYIYWKNGKKAFLWSSALSFALLLLVHLIFWPDIFSIWTFLPASLTPFLDTWRVSADTVGLWNPSTSFFGALSAFMEAIRYHLVAFSAFIIAWVIFLTDKNRREMKFYKEFISISLLFITLFGLHFLASFQLNYGVFTFSRYLSFFSFTGYLLGLIILPRLKRVKSKMASILTSLYILVLFSGIGFSAYQELDFFLTIQVPRLKNNRILPGTTDLWRLLANKFSLSFDFLQTLLPVIFCFLIGIGLVLVLLLLKRFTKISWEMPTLLISVFFVIAILLTPTRILGGGNYQQVCEFDIIEANEEVGNYINEIIPEGAQVFWHSNNSPTPLLYLEDIRVYPAQLDQNFTFYLNGDTEELQRLGYWNEELKNQWIDEAEYLLITDDYVLEFEEDEAFILSHEEIVPLSTTIGCRDKSVIHIFHKTN